MELNDNKQIFNLWDTNGRRADILNAIDIYLNILFDLKEEMPDMEWGTYPNSLSQFKFYKSAIEASPEVFKSHGLYDNFMRHVSLDDLENGIELSSDLQRTLDVAIEQRARHYTSNLVRLGLAKSNREITPVGKAYHGDTVTKDPIEDVFPIGTTNLLILRQLLKFKTYTKPDDDGNRIAYSPLFMALYVLLSGTRFDKDDFKTIVQSLTPYNPMDPDVVIEQCKNEDYSFTERDLTIPDEFTITGVVGQTEFETHVRNRKSNVVPLYYEFYKKLYDYHKNRTDLRFEMLKEPCCEDPAKLKQAFGNGHKVFDFGRLNSFSHEEFKQANANSPFLTTTTFNETFYTEFVRSKVVDQARENADTTSRLLNATGLISLGRALPELVNADIYELVFDKDFLKRNVFTTVSQEEYETNEQNYESNISLCSILGYSKEQISDILTKIATKLGKDKTSIKNALQDRTSRAFKAHVQQHYPADRVSRLLKGFSDSDGGASSREEINPSCGIPTAYEYIIALAWFYISDKKYDLYSSLNLTMGADFEPERFAPGGAGDIIAEYDDIIVMLEATMMNAQAQKRGEWEPVLRHSVNLRVDSAPKDTVTFFVANELDYNTINIWRAVAMVPLKSSNSDEIVSGVAIMPLTSNELAEMLDDGIRSSQLISAIKESYAGLQISFDDNWRESIISEVRSN